MRRLGSASRKNKLYFAFRELGRVIRTMFLLRYMSKVLKEMQEKVSFDITEEMLAGLSPYRTIHINRFGDYLMDLAPAIPRPPAGICKPEPDYISNVVTQLTQGNHGMVSVVLLP